MKTKKKITKKQKERAVVVYTDKRGVFFGYTDKPFNRKQMTLKRCRMCVSWDNNGVLVLSSNGPSEKCRITPATPEMTLIDLHGESLCSEEAIEKWEKQPWG